MQKVSIFNLIVFSIIAFVLQACASTPISEDSRSSQGRAQFKKITKLAVLVQDNYKTPARLIEDTMMQELLAKGYTVPSRSDLKRLMQEVNFQNSSLTNGKAAQIGKILNVPAVLIVYLTETGHKRNGYGSYSNSRNYATIGVRLIDVETSQVLWIKSKTGKANANYLSKEQLISQIAKSIAKEIPSI